MKYDNAELMRQLGAEYAIGTLRGAARRRFERLLLTDAEARAQVAFWELRLSEFGQVLHPVAPPSAARAEVLRHAEPALMPVRTGPRSRPRSLRRHLRWAWWPYAAGFSTAAALVLAFLVGQRNALEVPQLPAHDLVVSAVTSPVIATEDGVPMYVAQMRMPASSMGWLLSLSADHRKLQVTASDDFLQVGRSSVQLWCVLPGAEPIALGALPVERDAVASFDIPAAVLGVDEVSFAITLEPEDREHGGKPSRPVLSSAPALDAI